MTEKHIQAEEINIQPILDIICENENNHNIVLSWQHCMSGSGTSCLFEKRL